jgi:hypothetical protein
VSAAIDSRLASTRFPGNYHAELVTGTAATGLSANGTAVASTSPAVFGSFVAAALIGVLLIAHAATGSWRLAALAFGSLPVALSGGALLVVTTGSSGQLAASAGLLGVFALAARQAIAVTASRGARLGIIMTPAVVTAVALVPFAAMGDVSGLELLHTAAAVILAGLVTTTLVSLFLLPVGCRLLRPRPRLDSAMAVSAADAAKPAGPDGDHAANPGEHTGPGSEQESRRRGDGREGLPARKAVLAAPGAQGYGEPRERGMPRRGLAPVPGRSGLAVA